MMKKLVNNELNYVFDLMISSHRRSWNPLQTFKMESFATIFKQIGNCKALHLGGPWTS